MSGGYDFGGESECLHDTGKALRVRTEEYGEIWVPQGQVHEDSEVYAVGHKGKLIVTTWLAEERGYL